MDSEDPVALIRAKKKIQDIVDKEWIKSGRCNDTKRRLARYMGIRQPDYNSALKMLNKPLGTPEIPPPLRPEPETPFSDIPLAMNANSDFEGSSDFEEELLAGEALESDDDVDPTGTIEFYNPANNTKKNTRSSKSAVRKPAAEQSDSAKSLNFENDDDDVDTKGFNASFNLPKERTIESNGLNSEHNN
jgi:hypothetical protein